MNPTPAGVFGAVEVRNANEFYAASLDTVYRLFPDGGLTSTGFSTTAPITDLEFRSNELWAMTSSGPFRLNPNPQSFFGGAYGALLSSTSGALWAHGGAQVFRWTGTTWNAVTSTAQGPCSFAAAAVGGSLFRFCGTIPSTVLEELGPTMTLNVRTIDGGTLQSIGGRSPSTFLGVSLNPSMSSTVLVRISLAGDLLPLGPIQGSGEQVVFVSADETSAAFPGSYIELSSTTIQPTPLPLSGPVGASGSTFLLLQSGVPTTTDVLGGAVPFLSFTRGIAGSNVPLFFSTSVGDLISCGGTITTNGLHSPSSTTALAEHPETGEILFATFNRIQRQRGATIDTLPDAGLNVRFIEPMPDGGFLVAGENANVTFTRRWNGVAWEDVPIPFTLSGRRLGGLSVGDAGMFLSTSQALFAWTGTAWQSLPVPNVVGGDYGAVCATDDGLTLIEQLPSSPSGFRSVQRRRGASTWQSTLRSRSSHLVCRGGQGFDLANFSDTTYTRWLSDGGSQDVSERFDVKDVFFDREGRQYLATQSCGLLRKQ